MRDQDSVAMRVLERLEIDPSELRSAVHAGVRSATLAEQPTNGLTPAAKRVIELSVSEARRLRCNYVGTEHLLLGLMSEPDGLASAVLANATDADLPHVRRAILQILTRTAAEPPVAAARA